MTVRNQMFRLGMRAFEGTVRALGPRVYWKVMPRLHEEIDLDYAVDTKNGVLRLHCGGDIARLRAQHFFTSEPETIAWIDGFSAGDIFWDIGANIGVYSLYASFVRGLRGVAIEPSPFSFVELSRNLIANGLGERVIAICAAATDHVSVSTLRFPQTGLKSGGSGAAFDCETDNSGMQVETVAAQRLPGVSIDELAAWPGVPFPNHIKIDVVGAQDRIFKGAHRTLQDQRLKSVMVEIPADDPEGVSTRGRAALLAAGFTLNHAVRENNFFVREAG